MEKFWPKILPSYHSNNSFENVSIDVALKNCYENFNATACVRNVLLAVLGCATLFLCIFRVIRLHHVSHQQVHQYLVFYFASLEMMFLTMRWVAMTKLFQLEIAASYFKLIQLILLCHYFWILVSRILRKRKIIICCIVLLCFFFIILTAVTAFGILSHLTTWVECLAPHWLLLSIAELICSILYIIAGIYVTKNINSVSTSEDFRWQQKRELWGVIITYTLSSITSIVYYSVLLGLGDQESGCSGVFNHVQGIYSSVYASLMVIKYILPIWAMLLAFYPVQGSWSSEEERRLLGFSTSGSTTSTFTPRHQDSYRQLVLPVECTLSKDSSTLRRASSTPALTPMHRDHQSIPQYENYGAFGSCSPAHIEPLPRSSARVRTRRNSGHPLRHKNLGKKIPVSLNQGPDEAQSITPSSSERA